MKKLFLLFVIVISVVISCVGFAAPYQIDLDRWILVDGKPDDDNTFYLDAKSRILDKDRNTANVWVMVVHKSKDEVNMHNIEFKYPARLFNIKATILKRYSDGSTIDTYHTPYSSEKPITPGTVFEYLYELNDPSRPTSSVKALSYELPGTGMNITVPDVFEFSITRDIVNSNPEKFREIYNDLFNGNKIYLFASSKSQQMQSFIKILNIQPGEVKDTRELKSEIVQKDYFEKPELLEKFELFEKNLPGAKILAKDKHIDNNAIFFSITIRYNNNSDVLYMKNYKTNRNGKHVDISVIGKDKISVCDAADSYIKNIQYLD